MTAVRWVPILTTVALVAGSSASGDVALRLTAKQGDTRKYKLTAEVKFEGQDLSVTGAVTEKVLRVDDAGMVTVQVFATNTQAKAGGQAVPVQDSPAMTQIYRPDGSLSELRGENASQTSYRLETLTSVKLPTFALAVDKTWTWDIAPNTKLGIAKSSIVYKVVGEETVAGIPTWKISRSIKELDGDAPATDDGTVWVSKADGFRVKQIDIWKNAPVPNAPSAVDGTFTLELDNGATSPPASAHP